MVFYVCVCACACTHSHMCVTVSPLSLFGCASLSTVTFAVSSRQNTDNNSPCNLTTRQHFVSCPYSHSFDTAIQFTAFFVVCLVFTGRLSNILRLHPYSHLCSWTFAVLAAHGTVLLFYVIVLDF